MTNEPIYSARLQIDGQEISTTDVKSEVIKWMGRWITYVDFNSATLFRIQQFVEHRK